MNIIGVDVDSKLLVCKSRRNGKDSPITEFTNNPVGHRKFIKWATKYHRSAKVCMEATGVYSLPFALVLHQATNIEVMVANPRATRQFAMASMQRGKTDALDAEVIQQFAERMPFKVWTPPSEEILEIQHITRRLVQLRTELTRENNRNKAATRLGYIGRTVANDTAVVMRHLQRRIDTLEDVVLQLIKSIPELTDRLEMLTSVTGIANKTGARILAELSSLPEDMTGSQWVAYTGLDPRPYESGTSVRKPRRISKAGNRYLREALYFPALVASRSDKHVAAFYQHLISKGKKPMQVLVAIMRKLLLAIWGMFKHNQKWEGEKFYKIA